MIIDAHLDLAMNARMERRDLRLDLAALRAAEAARGPGGSGGLGTAMVTLPEMRACRMAVSCATLIARVAHDGATISYPTQEIAGASARGQLAYYRLLEQAGLVHILTDVAALDAHLASWEDLPVGRDGGRSDPPLGLIIAMEGADPILGPEEVPVWWREGLRVVSLAHYGLSTYAHGTGTTGGLTAAGHRLLPALAAAGMILDVTHLADQSWNEALDIFSGPVMASHSNCRSLVPGERQSDDAALRRLIARGGVIGTALDAWMLSPNWIKGATSNTVVSLAAVADHIDHVCQLAGNALHAAIGSDLDGGYGWEQCPHDLASIAGLTGLASLLRDRGYSQDDIACILWRNWARFFRAAWRGRAPS
ncbi:MAG: membrane dipeptidase [Chloroflexota bacterium]